MKIKCEICGKEFVPEVGNTILCPECMEWSKKEKEREKRMRSMEEHEHESNTLIDDMRAAKDAGISYGMYMMRRKAI